MSATIVTPNLEEVITEPQEQEYVYQPMDEEGRPLGGKQVLKYKTQEELIEKLKEQSIHQIRQMRELNKKMRLGEFTEENIPETAPRYDAEFVEFTPKPLSAEERIQISRDLLDPEKVEEAQKRLFEAEFGAPVDKVRKTLNSAQQDVAAMRARAEAELFMLSVPQYYKCPENSETITNWMIKNKLAPVKDNFKYAYDTLEAAGLLLHAPTVREETVAANTQPPLENNGRITVDEPTPTPRPTTRPSSGLNRNTASDDAEFAAKKDQRKYTLEEINRMPAELYKQKILKEPGFMELVEQLEAEAKRR